jgi:DNA-directed RNA polymerase specialized sigma24 family protein
MEPDDPAGSAALRRLDPAMDASTGSGAEAAVGALYRAQAVGLIRLAYLMLGDRAAAEDVVQDAFCGLYRRWDRLTNPSSAHGRRRWPPRPWSSRPSAPPWPWPEA